MTTFLRSNIYTIKLSLQIPNTQRHRNKAVSKLTCRPTFMVMEMQAQVLLSEAEAALVLLHP